MYYGYCCIIFYVILLIANKNFHSIQWGESAKEQYVQSQLYGWDFFLKIKKFIFVNV